MLRVLTNTIYTSKSVASYINDQVGSTPTPTAGVTKITQRTISTHIPNEEQVREEKKGLR